MITLKKNTVLSDTRTVEKNTLVLVGRETKTKVGSVSGFINGVGGEIAGLAIVATAIGVVYFLYTVGGLWLAIPGTLAIAFLFAGV